MIYRKIAGAALAVSMLSVSAVAQEVHPVSDLIAERGLRDAEADLAARSDPSPDELFALGGVRFLRAIETSLQTRWKAGAFEMQGIPILRLPVPPNPEPAPFDAAMVSTIFETALDDLAAADEALASIPAEAEIGLAIDLTAVWFDINGNGARDDGEDLFSTTESVIAMGAEPRESLVVRFDTADAAWLRAYAHLLSGISEVVLALDPTEAIATVQTAAATLGHDRGDANESFSQVADQAATVLLALRQQPDAARSTAALAHFETMVEQNLIFWDRVAAETDNEAEWIPNPQQTSAFGVPVTQEVADAWQDILREGGAVLRGDLLIPYWRIRDGRGINIRKVFEQPSPMDPVLWIQGAGALPYVEDGKLADSRNWRQFMRLLGGDAPLYALWFN